MDCIPILALEEINATEGIVKGADSDVKLILESLRKVGARQMKGNTIDIAARLRARVILSGEGELKRKVKTLGVKIIDLESLSILARRRVKLGDRLRLKLIRMNGEFRSFLGDGSEVIVNGRGLKSGSMVRCKVVSIMETPKYRKIFCEAGE